MIVMLAIVALVEMFVQCTAMDIVVAIPTASTKVNVEYAVAIGTLDLATNLQARHVVPEDRHRHPRQSLGRHLPAHQLWRIIPGALT